MCKIHTVNPCGAYVLEEKERKGTYEPHSSYTLGPTVGGCATDLALQQRLGILPKRWPGIGLGYRTAGHTSAIGTKSAFSISAERLPFLEWQPFCLPNSRGRDAELTWLQQTFQTNSDLWVAKEKAHRINYDHGKLLSIQRPGTEARELESLRLL
jgi:hypothetical protein